MKKSYKGYNKDMTCTGGNTPKQYERGSDYSEDKAKCCDCGMHSCLNPLDVFTYYPPINGNRYTEVEAAGEIDTHEEDSKISSTKLKIGLELNVKSMIEAGVKFIFEKTKVVKDAIATTGNGANAATTGYGANAATTGDRANAATTGDRANAATTGDRANAATTGDGANAATTGYGANAATTGYGANAATTGDRANAATTGDGANAEANGKESIAAAIGIENKAKAALGCWIVLSEWFQDKEHRWHIKEVKSAKVDGETIKADTWYTLRNGQFVETSIE